MINCMARISIPLIAQTNTAHIRRVFASARNNLCASINSLWMYLVGTTYVFPTDFDFLFVYMQKLMFSHHLGFYVSYDNFHSKFQWYCQIFSGLLLVSVFICFSFFCGMLLFERDHYVPYFSGSSAAGAVISPCRDREIRIRKYNVYLTSVFALYKSRPSFDCF